MSSFNSRGSNNPGGFGQYDESKHARGKDGKFDAALKLAVTTEVIA